MTNVFPVLVDKIYRFHRYNTREIHNFFPESDKYNFLFDIDVEDRSDGNTIKKVGLFDGLLFACHFDYYLF